MIIKSRWTLCPKISTTIWIVCLPRVWVQMSERQNSERFSAKRIWVKYIRETWWGCECEDEDKNDYVFRCYAPSVKCCFAGFFREKTRSLIMSMFIDRNRLEINLVRYWDLKLINIEYYDDFKFEKSIWRESEVVGDVELN